MTYMDREEIERNIKLGETLQREQLEAGTVPKSKSVSTLDYRDRQMKTFAVLGTQPTDWEWTGEFYETRDSEGFPIGICDLCGEHRLANKFIIKVKADKPKAGLTIGIGSTCINNYMFAEHATEADFQKAVKQLQNKVKIVNFIRKEFGLDYPIAVHVFEHNTLKLYTWTERKRIDLTQTDRDSGKYPAWFTYRYEQKKHTALNILVFEKQYGYNHRAWKKVTNSPKELGYGAVSMTSLLPEKAKEYTQPTNPDGTVWQGP